MKQMRFVRAIGLSTVAVATTVVCAAQVTPAPPGWTDLTARLERAATAGASAELRAVRAELLRLLTQPSNKEREPILQYAVAYQGWRMAFLPDVPEREQSDLVDDAVKRLEAVVKTDPKDAEALALLGGAYGVQIAKAPLKGMVLGMRASGTLERAAQLAPGNPRIILQQGVGAFNTPAMFGGGVEKAERLLRQSVELFAREPAARPWPNWGRHDAHAWLGQALLKKGDRAGAKAEYDKALAMAPGYGWLRYSLLPALERAGK